MENMEMIAKARCQMETVNIRSAPEWRTMHPGGSSSSQLIGVTHIFSVDLISYLTRFEWDMAKYPIKQPLKNISEALAKVI